MFDCEVGLNARRKLPVSPARRSGDPGAGALVIAPVIRNVCVRTDDVDDVTTRPGMIFGGVVARD